MDAETKKKGGAKKRNPITAATDKVLAGVEGLSNTDAIKAVDFARGILASLPSDQPLCMTPKVCESTL